MIDEEATFREYGYTSGKWAPKSHKLVIRVCDRCGVPEPVRKRDSSRLCKICAPLKRFEDPEERTANARRQKVCQSTPEVREKKSKSMKKYYEDPITREKNSQSKKKYFHDNPEALVKMSRTTRKFHHDHPEVASSHSIKMKSIWAQPDNIMNGSERQKQFFIDNPDERKKASARRQGVSVNKWTGFSDKSRPHVLPIHACTLINEWFPGCEGHHLSRSLVAFIPADMHKHIYHDLKSGLGMAEMNALALQFLYTSI